MTKPGPPLRRPGFVRKCQPLPAEPGASGQAGITGMPTRLGRLSLGGPAGFDELAIQAHVLDTPAHFGSRRTTVAQTANPHHVAALLAIRSGLNRLSPTSSRMVLIVSPRMSVSDGLARQQRGAPAETGRKRDFDTAHLHQRIQDQLVVERAVEVAAPVQRAFGDRQLFGQCGLIRRTNFRTLQSGLQRFRHPPV